MLPSTVPYALVVDDDPLILMDTICMLEDAGFRLHEAMSGDEAKVILDEHWESIVLVFSDVDMPGATNGFALARCLIPRFDGAILSLKWKEAVWDKFVMGAPRPRTPSEQQYSDRKLRSRR